MIWPQLVEQAPNHAFMSTHPASNIGAYISSNFKITAEVDGACKMFGPYQICSLLTTKEKRYRSEMIWHRINYMVVSIPHKKIVLT